MLVPIYKEKGDVQECQNYRGIKLLSHTMKIWERIVDKRVRGEVEVAEEHLGSCRDEEQQMQYLF